MPSFYLDHDLDRRVQDALAALGHSVVRTRELGLERADDATQLLRAAQDNRVFITHNERDFKLLQRAWRVWSVPFHHSGVLVIPQQRWTPADAAARIDRFLQSDQPLADELFWWTVDRDWMHFT